jgi:hypothetical protein
MPANEQAEKSILGGILQNNGLFYQAAGLLSQTFSLSAHSSIWEAMCDLHAMGQPIDIVTLPEQLEKKGKLESVNGTAYLMELTMGLPERTSIEVWVKLVRDKAHRRWLIDQCRLAEERLYDASVDTADCMEVMESAALRVRADAGVKSSHHISEIVPEVIAEFEAIRKQEGLIGFTTGVPCIDQATTGIRPDEYLGDWCAAVARQDRARSPDSCGQCVTGHPGSRLLIRDDAASVRKAHDPQPFRDPGVQGARPAVHERYRNGRRSGVRPAAGEVADLGGGPGRNEVERTNLSREIPHSPAWREADRSRLPANHPGTGKRIT